MSRFFLQAVLPVLLLAIGLAVVLEPWVEQLIFGGDFKRWLYEVVNERYDPRNCIIIAFALGFAVIPIIFTMATITLSSRATRVPRRLTPCARCWILFAVG